MMGSSMFAYSTNICIHSLVSGQQDWAHVTRVAKSCARSVSSAVRGGSASTGCSFFMRDSHNHLTGTRTVKSDETRAQVPNVK